DVEGVARHEMFQAFCPLRRADEAAGAAPDRIDFAGLLIDFAHRVAAADRTNLREFVRLGILRALLRHKTQDLRDDIAGALHDDHVADADVLAGDLVLIVERRIGDDDAADGHGLEPRHWRHRTSAAYLDIDPFEDRHRLLGGEFVGKSPARRPEAPPVPPRHRRRSATAGWR